MKMKNITIYLVALVLVGIIGSAGLASAFGLGFIRNEQRTATTQAIVDNDFDAWKAAITETLTQERFDKLVERHSAMSERMELQNALRQAIEEGNYESYKEASESLMNLNKVMSEEEFNNMVERYKARETGEGFGPAYGFGYHKRGFGGHRMRW